MPIPVVCGKLTGSMAAPIYGKTMIIRRLLISNKIFARKFNSNQMGVVYKIQKLYLKQVPKWIYYFILPMKLRHNTEVLKELLLILQMH